MIYCGIVVYVDNPHSSMCLCWAKPLCFIIDVGPPLALSVVPILHLTSGCCWPCSLLYLVANITLFGG